MGGCKKVGKGKTEWEEKKLVPKLEGRKKVDGGRTYLWGEGREKMAWAKSEKGSR